MANSTALSLMKQGDRLELQAGMCLQYSAGYLRVDEADAKHVALSFIYREENGTERKLEYKHNFGDGELIVGRHSVEDGAAPKFLLQCGRSAERNKFLSRVQALIEVEDGKVIYTHRASSKALPFQSMAAMQQAHSEAEIADQGYARHEGGSGASVTTCNLNPNRLVNEDRALAISAPQKTDAEAMEFLQSIVEQAHARTKDMKCGTTFSAAMMTSDKHYAIATIGDAPVYLIARHDAKQEIELIPLSVPHNLTRFAAEDMVRKGIAPDLLSAHRIVTQQLLDKNRVIPAYETLTSALGSGGDKYGAGADIKIIDPAQFIQPGYSCEGVLVGSDGIAKAVAAGAAQTALEDNPASGPLARAKAVAHSATYNTTDNITASLLPGDGLIAVADGHYGAALAAEAAIECVREACRQQALPGGAVDRLKQSRAGEEMGRW